MTGGTDFLSTAESLGREIWNRRIDARDGSVTWLRPGSSTRGEPVDQQRRVDPFVYDGTAGIALFLAALAYVTGDPEQHDRCLRAIAPVRRKLAELVLDRQRAAKLEGLGIGGLIGLGSLIYSFLRIGTLIAEPSLIEEARDLTMLVTPDRIARDTACDVLYGSAGAVLALLALHRLGTEPAGDGRAPLEVAAACGRHLLSRRSSFDGGPRTWQTLLGFPPLIGFSHGAAGICHALLCLYKLTAEAELLEAADEGFAFERGLYSSEHRSWRDPRSTAEPLFETSWCSGAAGIALARLGALDVLATQEIRDEVDIGLEATRRAPVTPLDHLCCGNMGRAEVLLAASFSTGGEGLRRAAESLAREVVERAVATGSFRCRPDMPAGLFDPSFFTGAAGVGYTLLRLAMPHALPSVVLLE